ncbi:MAG: right-handed parallel beta-helix repeat-containing protein [Thermoleophilia bacterium]
MDFSFNLVGNGMSGDTASLLTCADTVVRVVGVDFRAEKIRVLSTASSKSSNALSAEDATVEIRDWFLGGGNRWNDLGGCGLYLYGTTTGTVVGCMATENDLHGIAVQDEADVTLERNVCVYNTQCGISFSGDANGRLRDFNLCSYNGISGIAAQRQATLFVEKNICQYNAVAGISFFGTATGTIRSNECKYNQSHGIRLWEQSSALVEYNTAASNTEAGICFEGASGGTARNNTCSANKWGIYVGATATPSIGSNSLFGNAVNPQLYDTRSM